MLQELYSLQDASKNNSQTDASPDNLLFFFLGGGEEIWLKNGGNSKISGWK